MRARTRQMWRMLFDRSSWIIRLAAAGLAVGAACAMAQATAAAEGAGDDWPQLLGPSCNGISRETGLLQRFGPSGPPLLWERAVGAGYSAPSIRASQLV